jgi:predicted nucleic acid-binding protein
VALILDTGPIVAMLDASDPDHERCAALIAGASEPRIVPAPVLVEVEYLVRPWPGAFAALLADVARDAITVQDLGRTTTLRAGELLEQYRDLPLGFVDAAVIALAERLGERKIATLDHRHFAVVRPAHVAALELLPGGAP